MGLGQVRIGSALARLIDMLFPMPHDLESELSPTKMSSMDTTQNLSMNILFIRSTKKAKELVSPNGNTRNS